MNISIPMIGFRGAYSDFVFVPPIDSDMCLLDDGDGDGNGNGDGNMVRLFTTIVFLYLLCISTGVFMYYLRRYTIWYSPKIVNLSKKGYEHILGDMMSMWIELDGLTREERRERSHEYYVMTKLLVNRFRICVYEKILK
jgi:hypothetical protein